jgi:hypothetical protein
MSFLMVGFLSLVVGFIGFWVGQLNWRSTIGGAEMAGGRGSIT